MQGEDSAAAPVSESNIEQVNDRLRGMAGWPFTIYVSVKSHFEIVNATLVVSHSFKSMRKLIWKRFVFALTSKFLYPARPPR